MKIAFILLSVIASASVSSFNLSSSSSEDFALSNFWRTCFDFRNAKAKATAGATARLRFISSSCSISSSGSSISLSVKSEKKT